MRELSHVCAAHNTCTDTNVFESRDKPVAVVNDVPLSMAQFVPRAQGRKRALDWQDEGEYREVLQYCKPNRECDSEGSIW